MQTSMQYRAHAVFTACLLLASVQAAAGAACSGFDDCEPASASTLDQARGGFTVPSGLELSLGVERIVSINGELMSRTNVQLANVQDIGRFQLLPAQDGLAVATLVQNGQANFVFGNGVALPAGTFIQNTLNDQTIRSQTIVSANINSMSLLKNLNFNSSVHDAALGALAAH